MKERVGTQAVVWRVICCVVLLAALGCAEKRPRAVSVMSPDFFGISEELAAQLARNTRVSSGQGQRLILTTMVNIDDLSRTTRFGRTLTETLATRLFARGYGVIEIRKAAEIRIEKDSGELMLTRDLALIANQHSVEGVVVGTYSLTPGSVILNVKLLDVTSEDVLSVAGLEIKRSHVINDLLSGPGSGLADVELTGYERKQE